MLLVIDAGNTNITIGAYEGDELLFTSRLATDHHATRDRIAVDLASIFKLHDIDKKGFSGAIISSVVPEISRALKDSGNRSLLRIYPDSSFCSQRAQDAAVLGRQAS